MIFYLLHVRKYAIKKNDANRQAYPLHTPNQGSEVLVTVGDKFPHAFEYWTFKPDDFSNKSKTYFFKSVKAMFSFLNSEKISVGITLASFYKLEKDIPLELPPDGVNLYSYKNVDIFAVRK